MGLTMESEHCELDFGYGGFLALRMKVAELAAPDIGEHYKKLCNAPMFHQEEFFEKYNAKIEEISKAHEGKMDGILNFLYAPDCDAEISADVCSQLYEVIKDYDDDICYGYSGRPDCAMFKDFKELVRDCVDSQCSMSWR